MFKNKNLKESLIKDYYRCILELCKKFEPLLREGWTQDEVFDFILFMHRNKDKIKGNDIQEIKKKYLDKKNNKRRY